MAHTLAAVFETRDDAELAREALANNGFDRDTVEINAAPGAAADDSVLDNVRQMFSDLLGRDHGDHHVYAEAINRGHVVLTVRAVSHESADRAADIVDAYHPLDIDEQETQWRAGGWTGADVPRGGTGQYQGGPGMQQSAPEQHGIRPREEAVEFARSQQGLASPGSLQRADPGAPPPSSSPASATTLADTPAATYSEELRMTPRAGMRIYPPVAGPNPDTLAILRGDDADPQDLYFHSHWEKTYSYSGGTYQEFDPAYRYGEKMAGSSAYRERPFEHVEPELRGTWESTYPHSSWEKFKHAVREGWERITK